MILEIYCIIKTRGHSETAYIPMEVANPSHSYLHEKSKQQKFLISKISHLIFNQIEPKFKQLFLGQWETHVQNFVSKC
jgi:hypothetical protein